MVSCTTSWDMILGHKAKTSGLSLADEATSVSKGKGQENGHTKHVEGVPFGSIPLFWGAQWRRVT